MQLLIRKSTLENISMSTENTYTEIAKLLARMLPRSIISETRAQRVRSIKGLSAIFRYLPEYELSKIASAIRRYQARGIKEKRGFIEEFGISVNETPVIDGNTVRKAGSIVGENKRTTESRDFEIELYVADAYEPISIKKTLEDLSDLISSGGGRVYNSGIPIKRSYYQKFLVGATKGFVKNIILNLITALRSVAIGQEADVAKKLSKILERHQNIVVRLDQLIAIKVTKNRQYRVFIEVITADMKERLNKNQNLIYNPEILLEELTNPRKILPFTKPLQMDGVRELDSPPRTGTDK
jgi:hypothetical protein